MSLVEKYTPKTYKEIVGNKTTIDKLLKELKKSKFKGKYLLAGKPGTGKTSFVKILGKQKKWKIKEIKMIDIMTRGESGEKNMDIKVLFKRSIVPKIILIDDVDMATSITGIRNGIESKLKTLKTLMNKDKTNLIFILSTENKKSIFKGYEGLKTYSFKKIQDTTLKKYINKVVKAEKVKLSDKTGDKVIEKLIKGGDSNIRKILINLEMLMQGKKKLAYTEESKELIKKTNKDVTFKDIYEILGEAMKSCDMSDPAKLENKEKLFYNDSFIIQASVYEYYLKCENTKHTENMELVSSAINSIADGDILQYGLKDCDFSRMPFIAYTSYMKPTQICGKSKTQLFFPSNVSRINKANNNNKAMNELKFDKPELSNYSNDDFMAIYELQKLQKLKKKDQLISNTVLKKVFSLVD